MTHPAGRPADHPTEEPFEPALDDVPTEPDAPLPAVDPSPPAPRLGRRYTLEERLGEGGGAVVWRAFDEVLGRTVAVKVLRPELAEDPAAVTRFLQGAGVAARAVHPGIVAVYDAGVEDGIAWQALEHVDGPTLLEVLRNHPRGLPPEVTAAIGEQLATALGEAHAAGLVHRDVKPSNILVSPDGVVKLADFGVVLDREADRGEAGGGGGQLHGTRAYAAPEQLVWPDEADPRVDVFALGVVLHECLTGRPAFPDGRPDPEASLLPPRRVRSDVPRPLDAVVARATAADPADRPADGAALAIALRPLVSSDPVDLTARLGRRRSRPADATTTVQDPTPTGPLPTDSTAARRWLVVGILVLALVGVLTELATRQGAGTTLDDAPLGVAAGVPVRAVEVFDPYGSISSATTPRAAVDGDPTTVWRTPRYPVPLRSLATPGVGVWVDVGEPRAIDTVEVDLATPSVTVELLVRDAAPSGRTTEADWTVVDRLEAPGSTGTLRADGRSGRYWLVWFTELELEGEGWSAGLADLRFTTTDPTDPA